MTKLIRFLKPFWIAVIFTIALVFVQTMCDLSLPNLMSDVVNKGLTSVEYSIDEETMRERDGRRQFART